MESVGMTIWVPPRLRCWIGTARMRAIACAILAMAIWACGGAERAYASPCHQFTIARAVPLGFGVPYDVLSEGNAPLITGDCTEGGIAVSVGAPGQAVYRYGYLLDGGQWTKLELGGTPSGGDWLSGGASVTLPRPAAADAATSFLAFTCTRIGGFIEWKCGCRHYYCDVPMWQLQQFRYDAAPPEPEVLTADDDQFFTRTGEIRPDGSMVLLDGHIVQTTNFWTRVLPDRVPSDFTSPVNFAGGRMDVRLEVLAMGHSVPSVGLAEIDARAGAIALRGADRIGPPRSILPIAASPSWTSRITSTRPRTPFYYEICFENGTHGIDGWGETCRHPNAAWITAPGVYTWNAGRPPDQWWQNARRFDWQGGQPKRITINFRGPHGEVFLDDDLPLDINMTIIFTPEGKPFAGFD